MKSGFIKLLGAITFIVMPIFAYAMPSDVGTNASAGATDMMPIYNAKKYYKFDAKAVLQFFSGRQTSLQEITCPKDILLQQAGLAGSSRAWTYVTYEDTGTHMNISYDFVNCNINGYTSITDYNTLKPITEAQALETAKAFMQTSPIKDIMKNTLGDPIIVGKYSNTNNNPMPIDARSSSTEMMPIKHPQGEYIDNDQYTNISILFPYSIDGKRVYSSYGGRAGVSVEVTEQGVTSYNGQLISLPGSIKNAKPMSAIQTINYIKRGGNNPYYGTKGTVLFSKMEDIYTIVNDWRNNKNTLYLASATLFPTIMPLDTYSPWNMYEMVITDFQFANTNLNPIRMY